MDAYPQLSFGVLLKRFRRAANLTQAELAASVGLASGTIGAYERGARKPPRRRDDLQPFFLRLKLSPEDCDLLAAAAARTRISGDVTEEKSLPFSDLLRKHREFANLSQEDLAELADISLDLLRLYEKGSHIRPDPELVQLLVQILKLSGNVASKFRTAARGWKLQGGGNSLDALPLQEQFPMEQEVPPGLSVGAKEARERYNAAYDEFRKRVEETSLSVLLWPCAMESDSLSDKWRQIRRELEARTFYIVNNPPELADDSLMSNYEELERAKAADLTLILVEDVPAVLEKALWMCGQFEILPKMFAMFPEQCRTVTSRAVSLLSKAFRVYWYADNDVTDCNVLSESIEWCKARRLVHAFSKSRS